MPEKTLPNYKGEAEAIIVRAEVIADQLAADLDAFTAKFPFINEDYVTALNASIATSNELPLDNQVVGNIKLLTADVNAQVVLGRYALSDLNTYAKLTYKTDITKQRSFGQAKWEEAYTDQEKMENALQYANDQAALAPFATELAAKGFSVSDNENLLTIAANINSRNRLQEGAINQRPVTTQERIVQYNSMWEMVKDVSLAAKMLYRNDAAKYRQYLLYPNNTDTTTLKVTVNVLGGMEPMVGASVKIQDSELAPQTTDDNGQVTFASVNIAEFITLVITSPGGNTTEVNDLSITPGTTNNFTVEAEN